MSFFTQIKAGAGQSAARARAIASVLSSLRPAFIAVSMAMMLGAGLGAMGTAMAQSEPSLTQIYEVAASGNVPQAQAMVQQVLVAHPNSAKAHFVQAELFARQGNAVRARAALAEADRLAPGLPFVKPDAVQALRAQLKAPPATALATDAPRAPLSGQRESTAAPAPAASSFPTGLGLALGGAAIAAAIYVSRRKTLAGPAAGEPSGSAVAARSPGEGLRGPQTFGSAAGFGQVGPGRPGDAPAVPTPAPAAGGVMSGMAGGLATGLAVGAGVMAAQAIGRSFSHPDPSGPTDGTGSRGVASGSAGAAANPGGLAADAGDPSAVGRGSSSDLGGQNFGFNDTAGNGWDDAPAADSFSADAGGGGDWDT